jgi:8-oxo-dGTP pyrophosphatase MutT (NUDIX family)
MPKKNKERSAGFVIVRKNNSASGSYQVLALKVYGKLDIPKGHLDPGESDIQAAVRECWEEASIRVDIDRDMKWGGAPFIASRPHKDVAIFLAETDQEPEIRPNPENGRVEHDGYSWLSWDQMSRRCYPYLISAIEWARETVESKR